MKLNRPCFLIVIALLLVFACEKDDPLSSETLNKIKLIEYITEDYPPYNYYEGNSFSGVAVDILLEIWKEMGVGLNGENITLMNWSDGYNKTLSHENTMLFSTSRIPERENLFKWVGAISVINESIIALAGSGIEINSGSELANYSIGVVEGYSIISLLNDLGIASDKLIKVSDAEKLYKKLNDGEIDCIAFSETTGRIILLSLGYDPDRFESVYTLKSSDIYFAFNNKTDPKVIGAYQTTFDRLKEEKTSDGSSVYEKILNRYKIIQKADDNITDEMVKGLVEMTAQNLRIDQDAAIESINKAKAPYLDPANSALYVFVYDTTVTMLAHAANHLLVGVSLKGKPDVTGKMFRDEIVAGAMVNGSGWEDYIYTKPNQGGLYQKTTYYKLAVGSKGDLLVVCAGKYK